MSDAERDRLSEVEWADGFVDEGLGRYLVELTMYAHNRKGLLMDISKTITEEKIDVDSFYAKATKKDVASVYIGVYVNGRDEMNRVIDKLRHIEGVISIGRTSG